jgi:hypothetical protein
MVVMIPALLTRRSAGTGRAWPTSNEPSRASARPVGRMPTRGGVRRAARGAVFQRVEPHLPRPVEEYAERARELREALAATAAAEAERDLNVA